VVIWLVAVVALNPLACSLSNATSNGAADLPGVDDSSARGTSYR
jgi:hypothetical protein